MHVDGAIGGHMAANPCQVMIAKSSARHDLEAIRGQAGHRQIALDAAVSIGHLCVGNGSYWLIHLVVCNALQEG